jgi:ribosomal subunit interface protein
MKPEQIIIEGVHLSLTNKHIYVTKRKFSKLLNHCDEIISARVELIKEQNSSYRKKDYVAKGHLNLKDKVITASAHSDDIFKSIDGLIRKLDRSIRRYHRIQKFKRRFKIFSE